MVSHSILVTLMRAAANGLGTRAKQASPDNVYSVNSIGFDSESCADSEGRIVCGGCGRAFRPDGTRKKFCDHACYSASLRVPLVDRFWPRVNKFADPPAHYHDNGCCWLWTGKARIREYGSITGTLNGKRRPLYVHRVSWEFANGPVLDGLSVLHKCDVPLCVNPDHLFLGTQADNMRDCYEKGRMRPRGYVALPKTPFNRVFERVVSIPIPIRGDLVVSPFTLR